MCSDACLFIQGAAAGGQGDEGISLPTPLHIENSSAREREEKEKEREKGKEDLELFLTRSKALGVIRSCLE